MRNIKFLAVLIFLPLSLMSSEDTSNNDTIHRDQDINDVMRIMKSVGDGSYSIPGQGSPSFSFKSWKLGDGELIVTFSIESRITSSITYRIINSEAQENGKGVHLMVKSYNYKSKEMVIEIP